MLRETVRLLDVAGEDGAQREATAKRQKPRHNRLKPL
jgi:hypothetical protein